MSSAAAPGRALGGGQRAQRQLDAPSHGHALEPIASPMATLHASAGHHAVRQLLGSGAPLPDEVRAEMEARFGTSFADVRVHTNAAALDMARSAHANALACADDIVFDSNRFATASGDGKRLLAHELAHVVQQRRGGAAPAVEGGAFEASLEASADRAADAAVASSGPIDVAGASAPGIALSRASPDRSSTDGQARAEHEVVAPDGAAGWRQWLAQIESMHFDQVAGRWTITIEGQLYALHEAQHQRNLSEANNAIGGQLGKLRQSADTADRIDKGIRQIAQNGSWADSSITWAIERYYGVTPPGDKLTDAVREARAYAFQAAESQSKGEFLAAFDYLESGRVPAERAAKLATDYYEGLMAATQSMQDTIVGSWGDLLQLLLGVLKGVGSQATDLADNAFWATDELRSLTGGSTAGLMLATSLTGPLSPGIAPLVSSLADTHDLLKSMRIVDSSGRVSTTAAFSNTMQGASDDVTQTLGSNFAPDAILSPFNIGDIGGSLAVQAVMASTGVKEITLATDLAGAVGSLRTLVNTYRDDEDWQSNTTFWSGAIGAVLSLVGLGHWSGTNQLVAYALKSGAVLNLIPTIEQFRRDLANVEKLDSAEQNRRLADDVKGLAQAVFGLMQAAQAHPGQEGPDRVPPAAMPLGSPGHDAATYVSAVGEPTQSALPVPSSLVAGVRLAELQLPADAAPSAPRQVLPFKLRQGPRRPAERSTGPGDLLAPIDTSPQSIGGKLEVAPSPPMATPDRLSEQSPAGDAGTSSAGGRLASFEQEPGVLQFPHDRVTPAVDLGRDAEVAQLLERGDPLPSPRDPEPHDAALMPDAAVADANDLEVELPMAVGGGGPPMGGRHPQGPKLIHDGDGPDAGNFDRDAPIAMAGPKHKGGKGTTAPAGPAKAGVSPKSTRKSRGGGKGGSGSAPGSRGLTPSTASSVPSPRRATRLDPIETQLRVLEQAELPPELAAIRSESFKHIRDLLLSNPDDAARVFDDFQFDLNEILEARLAREGLREGPLSLREAIANARAERRAAEVATIAFKQGQRAVGKKAKGGPSKRIYNAQEAEWIAARQLIRPGVQLLSGTEVVGVLTPDGNLKTTLQIVKSTGGRGKKKTPATGREPDFVEIEGGRADLGELKSSWELLSSFEGGPGDTSVRTKSKLGHEWRVEDLVLNYASANNGEVVIKGFDVTTGERVTVHFPADRIGKTLFSYDRTWGFLQEYDF
ncbi:DUF4157 domain-containing protein [Variovorax sp. YR752]|uniref:eCIS core domain-containing protein n=1 Tax=Variovorax sp. YR752 TaxID=1884383 RepID=UPI003137F059